MAGDVHAVQRTDEAAAAPAQSSLPHSDRMRDTLRGLPQAQKRNKLR